MCPAAVPTPVPVGAVINPAIAMLFSLVLYSRKISITPLRLNLTDNDFTPCGSKRHLRGHEAGETPGGREATMSTTEQEERAQFTLAIRPEGHQRPRPPAGARDAHPGRSRCRSGSPTFEGATSRCRSAADSISPPPSIVAAMIAALELRPSHQVCELEPEQAVTRRCSPNLRTRSSRSSELETLAVEASARIKTFGLANVGMRLERSDLTFTARANGSIG